MIFRLEVHGDLTLGRGRAIGAVHRVLALVQREQLGECAARSASFSGLVAPMISRYLAMASFAFEYLQHDGRRGHEGHELAEEAALFVLTVKFFGLAFVHLTRWAR